MVLRGVIMGVKTTELPIIINGYLSFLTFSFFSYENEKKRASPDGSFSHSHSTLGRVRMRNVRSRGFLI